MRHSTTPPVIVHVLRIGTRILVVVRPAVDRTTSIQPLQWFQRN